MRHIFTFIVLLSVSAGYAQTGVVEGVIRSASGQVLPSVLVEITPGNQKDTTDAHGEFQFSALSTDQYTIAAMGIVSVSSRKIDVVDGQTTVIELVLDEQTRELQEFVVSGEINRYKQEELSTSLRLNAPILEVPQNIQTVSRASLDDQQVISMSDGVTRNVSGAYRAEHWGDMYANLNYRGSQIQSFRNGFNVRNSYWGPLTEDMSMIDHIEFVKGPAGFMVSYGDPGGMYNVVTKKPTGVGKGEINFTLGSFDLYRTALDLDGKLSKSGKFLYRLNVAAQNRKSFRANEFNDRYTIAPVVSYQLDKNTKLTVEYTYQRAHMSDVGSYYVFSPNGYDSLPRDATSLPAGLDPTNINDHSAYVFLDHTIAKNWTLNASLAHLRSNQIGSSMWPAGVNPDGTIYRAVSSWNAKSAMTMGQVYVNGKFNTGGIQHRVLGGLDLQSKEYFADWGQYFVLDTLGAPFNYTDPTAPTAGYPDFETGNVEQTAAAIGGTMALSATSAYVQEELGFFDNKLRLTLAGRYTTVTQSNYGSTDEAKLFTPRAGLSWSIMKNLAAYALYDQAFTPQTGILSNGRKVQPLTGTVYEFGVKKDWFGGRWNTTFSTFYILKQNELAADPFAPPTSNLSIEVGEKVSQGVEFDLRGNIARGLNLIANYAYTDSRVTKVAEGVTSMRVGDIVPGFNTHTANIWLSYRISNGLAKGLGFSVGGTLAADRHTYWEQAAVNADQLPDYMKLDAGIFWERNDLRVTANVFNVTNELLYSGSYYSWLNAYYTQYEAGRNLRLSIAYKF